MKLYGSESDFIESLQNEKLCNVLPIPEDSNEVKNVFQLIYNPKKWRNWVNSSGKGDCPPDFYSEKYQIMMEVMRIDDHGFVSAKNKIVNPTLRRESEIKEELRVTGLFDQFPNAKLHINADTGLSTKEDHNYNYYFSNFKRIVENHNSKVKEYYKNHPNYKLIFCVFDESSAYVETNSVTNYLKVGDEIIGNPHFWFLDKQFLEVIRRLSINYFIWYTPFKLINTTERVLDLPKIIVYDLNEVNVEEIIYKQENMISVEL